MTKINLILGNVEYEDKWDIFFNKFKTAINSEDLDSIKVMMQNSDLLDKERYINNLIRRKESFALQYGNIKYTYIPRESCGIYDNIFKMIKMNISLDLRMVIGNLLALDQTFKSDAKFKTRTQIEL